MGASRNWLPPPRQNKVCHGKSRTFNLRLKPVRICFRTFRQHIAEILLHSKYEETDSEQLAREVDLPPARDNALVPHQKERSDDALAV